MPSKTKNLILYENTLSGSFPLTKEICAEK